MGNKLLDPVEELALIEKELNELKIAFDQFLLGTERRSPIRRKDKLGERIRKLKSSGVIRQTALRFRLDQLHSKYGSYDRMWTRSIQERESGTYRADLFKLKHRAQAGTDGPPAPASEPSVDRAPSLTDGQVQALYETLLVARARTGEATDNLSFDGLAKTLRKQLPQLIEKHQCSAVDFKVVIREGKAVLKAVPRK